MVFTAAQRAAIAENDPSWLVKLRIRAVLSLLLFIPLGCLASVVAYSSNFQSPAFEYDTRVWPCLLLIILSWAWDATTVAVYTKWKRPLNPLIQLLVHGLLTLLFIIVGAVSTHNAATASSLIHGDPYAPAPGSDKTLSDGGYKVTADNGSTVLVTAANEKSCPAFANCTAQADWVQATEHRAGVAIAGCALFLLLMPIHLLLTALFIRDYRARLSEQQRLGSDAFQMDTTPPALQSPTHTYGDVKLPENRTTSQVYLLREGRGGLGFHKPHYANDSVLSVATSQTTSPTRPSTATTTRSRARFMRPKSTGPSLPLAFPMSRSASNASTIAGRSRSNASTIASRRQNKADPTKDLPPVPTINTSMLRVSTTDSLPPLTPDTVILTRSPMSPPHSADLSGTFPRDQSLPREPNMAPIYHPGNAKRRQPPPPLDKPSPPKLSIFPAERSSTPPPIISPRSPVMARGFNKTGNSSPVTTLRSPTTPAFKISFEGSTSNSHGPFNPDEISALPAIPPEGIPRRSRDSSGPTSPTAGPGELEMLRSLRSTLFASDADTRRSRSSAASGAGSNGRSSPFGRSPSPSSFLTGNSGRQSPWSARKERRELLREIENEREQREKELLDAEQRAHRAAEKMESAYLRDEMRSADEKAAMRKKRIEDRIQQLKDTLENLKQVQDEEERRAEQRAEQRAEEDRREMEDLQREPARYGDVVAARAVEHQRQESTTRSIAASNTVAGSRPTTRGGETRPSTRGTDARPGTSDGKGKEKMSFDAKFAGKALPPVPPTVQEEGPADSRLRYSWETGHTVAHTRRDNPG